MSIVSYGAALARHAELEPDADAIVHDDRATTRLELLRSACRCARALQQIGVDRGDFVTIALPNGVAFFEWTFGAWSIGAVPQPVSSRLPRIERAAILERAQPRVVVGVTPDEHPGLTCIPPDFDTRAFDDAPLPDVVAPNRQALTSGGSTGTPKVIVDTLPAEIDPEVAFYGLEVGATTLVPGPLYHAGPFLNATMALMLRGKVVLMSRFDAEQTLRLLSEHRIHFVNLVPTMMQRIWRLPEDVRNRYDLSALQRVYSSGAPCPTWLKREWIEWLGPERIFESYGATERIGGTMITGSEWLKKPGSVGRPTGGRRIRILGEEGQPLGPGEVGEVFMMPPGGQGSTYRYIGAEARATRDGWESLGDMGYLDEDGYLFLVERRGDMILCGGSNIYPAEIEAAIDSHPKVLSSAVIGLPHEDLGARVHAIVQAHPPVEEDELRRHLAERLVRYKIPRTFEFVAEALRDDAGKVRRSKLRAQRLGETT